MEDRDRMEESDKLIRNEAEAIECLKSNKPTSGYVMLRESIDMAIKALEEVQQYRAIGTPEELQDMKSNYFEALSDWRQYRKIGTVEECRTAREKQISKKPRMRHLKPYDSSNDGWCPCCEAYVIEESNKNFCPDCGQKLDWSDENEEID